MEVFSGVLRGNFETGSVTVLSTLALEWTLSTKYVLEAFSTNVDKGKRDRTCLSKIEPISNR